MLAQTELRLAADHRRVLKITYDLALLRLFHDVRPPEELAAAGRGVRSRHGTDRAAGASPAWGSTSTGRSTARRWRSGWARSPRRCTANTQLPVREREAARWTIALINDCVVCQDTRAKDAEPNAIDEGFYAEVAELGHHRRAHRAGEAGGGVRPALRARPPGDGRRASGRACARAFSDDEVADLIICCGMFLGLGRAMAVVGVPAPEERILV